MECSQPDQSARVLIPGLAEGSEFDSQKADRHSVVCLPRLGVVRRELSYSFALGRLLIPLRNSISEKETQRKKREVSLLVPEIVGPF